MKAGEETDVTFDPPRPKQKLFKEQRNRLRKQERKPVSQIDKGTDRMEVEEEGSVFTHHVIEVNVEIIDDSGGQKTPSHPVKPCCYGKSTTLQRVLSKPHIKVVTADSVPSSPSRTSIISETAVEELCQLRNYYSKQLRRINYISHEYLGQPSEPGVLACLREPLRGLRLPRALTISQTARNLWMRVSGRRKLINR